MRILVSRVQKGESQNQVIHAAIPILNLIRVIMALQKTDTMLSDCRLFRPEAGRPSFYYDRQGSNPSVRNLFPSDMHF